MIPNMKYKNYPKVSGIYFASNYNQINKRIEVEKVSFNANSGDVVVTCGIGGYIPQDWSFWSDKVND